MTLTLKVFRIENRPSYNILARYWNKEYLTYSFILYDLNYHKKIATNIGCTHGINKKIPKLNYEVCRMLWNAESGFNFQKRFNLDLPDTTIQELSLSKFLNLA